MASEIHMPGPVCLIKNTKGQLRVNQEALEILSAITEPVVVVAIAGLYRTGKSYLMNKLAGKNKGFPLGSTVRSETKGIWMWCMPHPYKPNNTLVLLDTEGLGDVEKGDLKNDSWIFALAVLLSSTFVYNSMGTINLQALEQLHYVTKLSELIRTQSCPRTDEVEDSSEFVSFFPDFVWAVRDFMLELKLDEHPITEDEYLGHALKLIQGENPQIKNSNLSKECIRYFFPKRKCFVFDRPTSDKKLLVRIEDVPEYQLDYNFQKQSRKFCSYIYSHAKTKNLGDGIIATGKRLGTLVVTYVEAINSGGVPCLENAVTTLALLENSAAVQKAADQYSQQMAQQVKFPTETLQEFLGVHEACEKEAIAVFNAQSFKNENQEFQQKLVETIRQKMANILQQNEDASTKYCQEELKRLSEPLMKSISRGTFCVPGGHSLYLEEKKKLEHYYNLVPRKGVKANEELQRFLQSLVVVEKSILQTDKALTTQEKASAAERTQNEIAEKEEKLKEEQKTDLEQMRKSQERIFWKVIDLLQEIHEKNTENRVRDLKWILDHKLQVQEQLCAEGFPQKSEKINKEINRLLKSIELKNNEKSSLPSKIFEMTFTTFVERVTDFLFKKACKHLKENFK
ncbi:guanylate-binding protein 7-like [Carlito syrichta]|uniref:Guanylate-binding protein 7-like n=1 Tax=Carlito syrichta TaxID=1868482 RepID=A0A1U7UEL4_CARSF|nr:guanylate-binding protein 7-like [Carlito syrichta]